jgi:hypothetical protein
MLIIYKEVGKGVGKQFRSAVVRELMSHDHARQYSVGGFRMIPHGKARLSNSTMCVEIHPD